MNPLTPKRRSELRSEAHKLNPLVIIGDKGLTDEVLAEIDRTLKAHELIKVRANTDDRAARDEWLDTISVRLQAHPVQQIGKIFVLYRENPEDPRPARPVAAEKAPRRGGATVSERGQARQRSRDEGKRRERDVADMVRKGKIKPKVAIEPGVRREGEEPAAGPRQSRGAGASSAPPSARRKPSLAPPSAPRRRRPRTP